MSVATEYEHFDHLPPARWSVLYEGHGKLSTIPTSIFSSLTYLNCDGLCIDYDVLNTFIINFAPIGKLQGLNLEYARLKALPESIGRLLSLKLFSCSNNHLTYLPESIGNLVNLQRFWCNSNSLISLPESIGNLVSLRWLYCHDNKLTSLPSSMGYLSQDLSFGSYFRCYENKFSPEFTKYREKYYWDHSWGKFQKYLRWWSIIRLIWIGWKDEHCPLSQLPQELIHEIINSFNQ